MKYAAALGARVIATAPMYEKLQMAKELGASEPNKYNSTSDWEDGVVLRFTNGEGAKLVRDVGE